MLQPLGYAVPPADSAIVTERFTASPRYFHGAQQHKIRPSGQLCGQKQPCGNGRTTDFTANLNASNRLPRLHGHAGDNPPLPPDQIIIDFTGCGQQRLTDGVLRRYRQE
ncbi:hypothetical protein KCP77_08335 [Salmonella enterica subsp. enterica]|nr:hypothetical protein KCP77_08335 [Salmonella enterica subsp. enterica]